MAPLANGQVNGHVRNFSSAGTVINKPFYDIPSAIDIPVGADVDEAVEVNLDDLFDDPTELCTLLENENAAKNFWLIIARAYAKQQKVDLAIEILNKGLASLSRGVAKEKIGLLSLQCWLYLGKSREAPRVVRDGELVSEAKTKDYYLQLATGVLNEASRIAPSFPPLYLARGVLSLLRASLYPPTKVLASGALEQSERLETLRQALKVFDEMYRNSNGRNMMASFGKARTLFSMGRYADALDSYQEIMTKMPELHNPDPRIGIGCCLWQLTYREEAREAWERALEIDPDSKVANILLGISYLYDSSKYLPTDAEFVPLFKKAMTLYTQRAYKIDAGFPLTCATFGGYFLPRKMWEFVDKLARKAIEYTDVNAIASDGWYLLARKEHYQTDPTLSKASDFYNRADNARGGGDRGHLPARFGSAQVQILNKDLDGAKFRLEKIVQHSKCLEAMVLLGMLYAQEVFANQTANVKEDKSNEAKKALMYLEAVRLAWKDSKQSFPPDKAVLVILGRLYEAEHPEKSLQCLLQVQQMAFDDMMKKKEYSDIEDEEMRMAKMRQNLPPSVLNNIGCFHYQAEKYDEARELFETALNACITIGDSDEGLDTDALVTSISFNLARTWEAAGSLDEARKIYEGLLARHDDYVDAKIRLAFIELRQNPTVDGPKAVTALYTLDESNLEVRSLYGWFLSRSKKRPMNIADDPEQRHYKRTLQLYDKHDQYSLTGMGNLYLTTAREMRRDTDQEREKRRKTFEKAVEFFLKAIQLDPRNAYAAQGIGIALAEDKKEFTTAVQVFSKVKETMKEASVFVNLGHVYGELKQYSRAIENYELALAKDRAADPQILACLGRAWLLKGKHDKSISAMKSSLEYSKRALEVAPEQIHFQFNIAFVETQLASLIYTLPDSQRTLVEVQAAAEGLDHAIESLVEIAKAKNPPYPRHDIEQRANMGKNTMRKQLERAVQQQMQYEEANASKLAEARRLREEEIKKREDERRVVEEKAAEEKRRLAEERHKLLEVSRELAEKRAEEEKRREEAEWTEDSEGERVKRKRKAKGGKRKKKGEGDESDDQGASGEDGVGGSGRRKHRGKSTTEGSAGDSGDEKKAPRKKRKLAPRKATKAESKIKSSEIVTDSGSDGEDAAVPSNGVSKGAFEVDEDDRDPDTVMADVNDEDEDEDAVQRPRKKASRRIEDDDEGDPGEDVGDAPISPAPESSPQADVNRVAITNGHDSSAINGANDDDDDDDDED